MGGAMTFADKELAKRLEAAEGFACAQFAEARRRLFPECGSEWRICGGTTVVFDGVDAPTTQTFGLGMFGEATEAALGEIEEFFAKRGTAVMHEVCPYAGTAVLEMLCKRGYAPMEVSNVMYRAVEAGERRQEDGIRVRTIGMEEAELWSDVSTRGWAHEHPELEEFMKQMGVLCVARDQSPCFLAELDGVPGAAGALVLHEGVALFAGAATVPELRRRGLQGALLGERMQYAAEAGCDLAMMVAEAGSNSQRNAERLGFRVAYTRLKWRLGV